MATAPVVNLCPFTYDKETMMSDFTLEPDELEPERPYRPARLVATGLAPTAAIPSQRRRRGQVCHLAPCEACGRLVLVGHTSAGQRLALDTGVKTYVVDWQDHEPLFSESRGYPVHRCVGPGSL